MVLAVASAEGAEGRYELWLRNGTRVTARRIEGLFDPSRHPRLDGRELIRPQVYLLAIHDTSLRSRLSGPYVELINGDVLPGVVYAGVPAGSQSSPASHIIVKVAEPLMARRLLPGQGGPSGVAIQWPLVKRLVCWSRSSRGVKPGIMYLRDGRHLAPQAIRLTETGIVALTDDGVSRIAFSELGEVHLPRPRTAEAVLADGVWWQGDAANPVVRIGTTNGARLTFPFSMARVARGRVLSVRPRWSRRTIHLDTRSIVWITFRSGDEVPLSLLPAQTLKTKALLHHGPWRRNRNVHGTYLRCGSMASDLGVGTHSYSQVAFDLPAKAKTFSTWVGLDVAAGWGGCASCSVYRDKVAGRPLWEGRFLRGSSPPVHAGPLNIAGAKRLVLVTDFAHEGRPAGADPLDVRDFVDWLMPLVTVDRASLPRLADDIAHWMPDKIEGYTDTPLVPGTKWHLHDPNRPQPKRVDPKYDGKGVPAPGGATILFDGKDMNRWKNKGWKLADGYMQATKGYQESVEQFGDIQLHVEWYIPTGMGGTGQGQLGSGVFMMGKYEIQIMNSYNNWTYADGAAAAIFGQHPPMVNACRPPGKWQSFDIYFKAPIFKGRKLEQAAYITVYLNNVLVHDNVKLMGETEWRKLPTYTPHGPKGPILLQAMGSPERFRNIWVRPLEKKLGPK